MCFLLVFATGAPCALLPARAEDTPPRLRGIAETREGRKFEGWIRVEGTRMIVDQVGGEGAQTIGAGDLKVAHMHLPGAPPPKQRPPEAAENGLLGSYFRGRDLRGKPQQRVDRVINFKWSGKEPMRGFTNQNFSVRWEGEIEGPTDGKIRFRTTTDDGIRVWVGGTKIIDQWRDMAATDHRGEFAMQAKRRYPIRIEYFQGGGDAVAALHWEYDKVRQVVPSSHLFARPAGSSNRASGLWLKGGSFLAGTIGSADKRAVEIGYLDEDFRPIPRIYLAAIQFSRLEPSWLAEISGRKPGCYLWDGDYFESELVLLKNGKLKMTSILFGPKVFDRRDVLFVKCHPPAKSAPAIFEIRTRSGSTVRATSLALDGERAEVLDASRLRLQLAPEDVATVHGVARNP